MEKRIIVDITESVIDLGELYDFLRMSEGGAVNLFVGTTRKKTESRETVRLNYEAAPDLALAQMNALVSEALSRWPVLRAVCVHRVGEVPVTEASVIIGVATPHRVASFEATRFLIDELKRSVPVWKKEFYADGASEWVEGTTPG